MKILLFANTDWYLYNFRMSLAAALRTQGHDVVLLSPPGKHTERLESAGFRCIGFPLERRRLNPFAELKTIVELVKVYRRERPELVHHFTMKCVLYGSIAARLASIGAVVNALTGLGLIFSDPCLRMCVLRRIISLMCRLVLRRTQVIFQNPEDQGAFHKHKLVADNASHLIRGSGVDTERFKPRNKVRNSNKRYVLLASRLLWAKGLAEYVEAARLVRKQLPEAVFLIAGESDAGNPDTIPANVIARWKREGNVILLGHCEDMRGLIEDVDLVALPTYYGEGVPRILIEAAACGKPLVATQMPGCSEIVHHNKNGLLVPPRDSQALAHAIAEILPDDIRCTRLGKHSRQLACEEFAEDLVISRTFDVYQLSLSLSSSVRIAPAASQPLRKIPLRKLLPGNPTASHQSEQNMGTVYLASFVAALLGSLILTRTVRDMALRRGWTLKLSAHHIHHQPVPRLGGVAIFTTVVLVAGLARLTLSWFNVPLSSDLRVMQRLFIPTLLVFALGLYDDLKPLSARVKFSVQGLAALLLYAEGFGRFEMPALLGLPGAQWLSLPLTILFVLFITNAFNLIDGLDGLAAGSSLFSTATMFIVALVYGHHLVAVLTITMAGATLGFLRYNFNPATIFLGDSGSLFLGFLLAALALESSEKMPAIVAVALPIVLFGLPLAEILLSVVRRFLSGRPLFTADCEHIHHKLLERGLTQRQAVSTLYGVSAICGLLSLLLLRRESGIIFIVWFVLATLIWVGVKRLGYHEFNELGCAARRAIRQKRVISNDLVLRRAARQMGEARSQLEVFSILQGALEASGLDGCQLTIYCSTGPRDWMMADEPRPSEQCVTWYRPTTGETRDDRLTPEWTLTLEMETSSHENCGQLSIYRQHSDQALLVDLNLLTAGFNCAMADALVRIAWQPAEVESAMTASVVAVIPDERVPQFGFRTAVN